jgi:MFS family permease
MSVPALHGQASVITTLREMPASGWTLLVGSFINKLGSFLQIFLVLYLSQRGFTAAQAGLALGMYGAGSIVGVMVGGSAADRFGYRGAIVGSMVLSAFLTIALVYTTNYPLILAIVAATGAAAQAYRPASSALLTALTPASRHVMVFAAYRLSINLGMTVGPIFGAFFAQYSYKLLLWADAVTSLAFGVLATLLLPRTTAAAHEHEEASPQARGGYLRLLVDRRFLLFLVALFLHAVVYIQYLATLPMHLSSVGFSPRVFGVLVSMNALIVVLFELPITQIVQRHPARFAVALGIGLAGVGFNLYALPASMFTLALATIVWSLGEIVGAPAASAYPARIAPSSLRGRYMAASAMPQSLGYAVGPVIGVALWTRIGPGVWWACGLLTVLAVLATLTGVAREAPQGHAAPA